MNRQRINVAAAVGLVCLAGLGCKSLTGGGKSELTFTHSKVKETKAEIKAGHTYASTKTFTKPDGKGGYERNAAAIIHVVVANHPLDSSFGLRTLGTLPKAAGEVKVQFSLVGKDGTSGKESDAAPEVGVYTAKADRFMKVESVGILAHDGSAGTKNWFNSTKLDGQVEITSADDGKIEGKIDVNDGEAKLSGNFVATLGKGAAPEKN